MNLSAPPTRPNTPTAELIDLVEELARKLQTGGPADVDAFLTRHAEHADQLRRLLPTVQVLADLSLSSRDSEPAVSRSEPHEPTGVLGDFRILREVGRGGMGIVYEAEQISLGRRVALKVLPFAAVMDAKQLQRFKNEAHAAAQLHHTNIVPVFFVGCERGVHFYAMQFIEGRTLADVIRELRCVGGSFSQDGTVRNGLRFVPCAGKEPSDGPELFPPRNTTEGVPKSLRTTSPVAAFSTQRSSKSKEYVHTVARLGIQAAEALDHAHQVGILHRDVKPSNLLLDVRGNLWITDFGLARLATDASLTMTGDILGTIRYMSPEQALAKRVVVDQRTDVYSLGVTLYELLTLEPAFGGQDREEILRQIAFDEPRQPKRLNSAVPTELETIVLKAMAKNPDERYATAQDLADDLKRFLTHKPILAKPPTLLQTSLKWSRRNTPTVAATCAAAAVTAILLAIGTILLASAYKTEASLRRDAQENLDEARRAVDSYFAFVSKSMLLDAPSLAPLRNELLESTLGYYKRFKSQHEDDPELLAELAAVCFRVAQVDAMNGTEEWLDEFEKGLDIVEELLRQRRAIEPLHSFGSTIFRISQIPFDFSSSYERERGVFQRACQLWERLVQRYPDVPAYRLDLAGFRRMLANYQGTTEAALVSLRNARRTWEELARQEPNPEECMLELGLAWRNEGEVLVDVGRPLEAKAAYLQALAIRQELVARRPEVPLYQSDLGGIYRNLGNLLRLMESREEAVEAYSRALAINEGFAAEFPGILSLRATMTWDRYRLGVALAEAGRIEQARAEFDAAAATLNRLPDSMFSDSVTPAIDHQMAGDILRRAGRNEQASAHYRAALQYLQNAEIPMLARYWLNLSVDHEGFVELLVESGRIDEAAVVWLQMLEFLETLVHEFPGNPVFESRLARHKAVQNRASLPL